MKRYSLLFLSLVFIGCASPRQPAPQANAQVSVKLIAVTPSAAQVPVKTITMRPPASFTSAQATQLAIQLANEQAARIYHCKPFHDGRPAAFTEGCWRWHELTPSDYEAEVQLLADGSPNRVTVNLLTLLGIP